MNAPTVAELVAKGETPEVLFWVGCAGSFDDRAKRVTKAFVKILNATQTKFAVGGSFKGKKITYHDSCYLGRSNNIYDAPREVLQALDADLVEMKRCRTTGLCCGAGGAQMFKEPEKGKMDINVARSEEALATGASTIAVACPFCMTMMTDGVKNKEKEGEVKVKDLAELIAESL